MMKQESGRSLIEIIGVLAIGAVMAVAAVQLYGQLRESQMRTLASHELERIVKNVKILTGARGSYAGVSIDYLIKAGALASARAPIGNDDWSISPTYDEKAFTINLIGLTSGECEYFSIKKQPWATTVLVNGQEATGASNCFSTKTNQVSFVVE